MHQCKRVEWHQTSLWFLVLQTFVFNPGDYAEKTGIGGWARRVIYHNANIMKAYGVPTSQEQKNTAWFCHTTLKMQRFLNDLASIKYCTFLLHAVDNVSNVLAMQVNGIAACANLYIYCLQVNNFNKAMPLILKECIFLNQCTHWLDETVMERLQIFTVNSRNSRKPMHFTQFYLQYFTDY